MENWKTVLIFNIIITFNYIESKIYNSQYCSIICHNIKSCSEKCNKFIDNGITANYQTPHCGITGFDEDINERIIGGYDSELYQFPWFTAIYVDNSTTPSCGGVILNDRFILTAAHCFSWNKSPVYEVTSISIQTNSLSLNDKERTQINPMLTTKPDSVSSTNQTIAEKYIHPKFFSDNFQYKHDIALIKTSRPIEFVIKNSNQFAVNSICLPKANDEPNGRAVLAGSGVTSVDRTKPNIIQTIELQIIDNRKCQNIIDESNGNHFTSLTSQMFCTIGSVAPGKHSVKDNFKGGFKGDSGSSLIQYIDERAYAIGIVSFGGYPNHNNPTETFTKISKYIDWIEETINNNY